MEKCKVIVKKIGVPAEESLLENTYEAKKELVGGAIAYIITSKKSGKGCIGCPDAGTCGSAKNSGCSGNCGNCGGGCHCSDEE